MYNVYFYNKINLFPVEKYDSGLNLCIRCWYHDGMEDPRVAEIFLTQYELSKFQNCRNLHALIELETLVLPDLSHLSARLEQKKQRLII